MADMRTPLAKVRGLGSAKDGTHHWWVQRLTAIANVPLSIFLVVSFVGNAGKGHADWAAWLAQPVVAVLMILFVANATNHMRLGLQVAIEDYIHSHGSKTFCMIALTFVSVLIGALGIFSILRVAFGS